MSAIDVACTLAKPFESCRLTSYQDPAGIWTIGWGSTFYRNGYPVKEGQTISQGVADGLLAWGMTAAANGVLPLVSGGSINQQAAMIDLAYNIGLAAFRSSSVLRLFLAGDIYGAADAFLMWDKAHVDGQLVELDGLLRRRQAERALFLSASPAVS